MPAIAPVARYYGVRSATFADFSQELNVDRFSFDVLLRLVNPGKYGRLFLNDVKGNRFEISGLRTSSSYGNNLSNAGADALYGPLFRKPQRGMAQAFGVLAFPVDTLIHRLAQRWGLSNGSSVERTERDLKALFPRDAWNKLHLQIIVYGREHCTARGCDGRVCPLCREFYPQRRRPVIWHKP